MKSTKLWARYLGTDKAVKLAGLHAVIKGHNPSTLKNKNKITLIIRTLPGCFGFKLSENFNNALRFNQTKLEKCVLKFDL